MYSLLLNLVSQIILTGNTPYRVESLLPVARDAILHQPAGLAEDAAGNLYIAEPQSNRIRRITPAGILESWASANSPTALLIEPNQNLLYFDSKECMIRRIRSDLTVENVAGSGTCAAAAGFSGPPVSVEALAHRTTVTARPSRPVSASLAP
ncbi:MAG: hypothetical protein FJW36_20595 [Acidobacteria bacterium]|nr:hypothetical protein [Acidobacteriota bacterium]